MVKRIYFKGTRFTAKNDYNVFGGLTSNTIVLCRNWEIMQSFADEIVKTINGKAEYNDCYCDDGDIGKAEIIFRFGLQCVIEIGNQHITLGLEPAIIYKANSISDVWFVDSYGTGESYTEIIYPIYVFKSSHVLWEEGMDEVYGAICAGKFGGYDGNWVNLHSGNGMYSRERQVTSNAYRHRIKR